MSLLNLVAFAAMAQVPALPNDVAVLYSGVPGCAEPRSAIKMLGHSVTATLEKVKVVYETTSLFKNMGGDELPTNILLPVDAQNPSLGRGYDIRFKALWDKSPVQVKYRFREEDKQDEAMRIGYNRGVAYQKISRLHSVPVVFKPNSTHSLRLSFEIPVGKGGLDGMQRWVAYNLAHINDWGRVDQLNFSLKFMPNTVFQTYKTMPGLGWQVGPKGAFFKVMNFAPSDQSLAAYVFYPSGYDRIGQ